jgi:hypothetical protein
VGEVVELIGLFMNWRRRCIDVRARARVLPIEFCAVAVRQGIAIHAVDDRQMALMCQSNHGGARFGAIASYLLRSLVPYSSGHCGDWLQPVGGRSLDSDFLKLALVRQSWPFGIVPVVLLAASPFILIEEAVLRRLRWLQAHECCAKARMPQPTVRCPGFATRGVRYHACEAGGDGGGRVGQ